MTTPALTALRHALGDVDNLITHHPKSTVPGRGRPATDEGPLLRSCILLAYAAWEVYVEDSLLWAVEQLVAADDPDRLPAKLREYVGGHVKGNPWALAGDGWASATTAAVRLHVLGDGITTFGINIADPVQIDKLHERVLGTALLGQCGWSGRPSARVREELDQLVSVRGEIAHTGQIAGSLYLAQVRDRRKFVELLAKTMDKHLETWVAKQLQP